MEGVVAMKFPSFSVASAASGHRSFSLLRRSFSISASSTASSSATISTDSEPISIGHRTRKDFRILHQIMLQLLRSHVVLDALKNYHEFYNSNVHRGIHYLSAKASDEFELARKKVARFINASDSREIVFTRNATEAINVLL